MKIRVFRGTFPDQDESMRLDCSKGAQRTPPLEPHNCLQSKIQPASLGSTKITHTLHLQASFLLLLLLWEKRLLALSWFPKIAQIADFLHPVGQIILHVIGGRGTTQASCGLFHKSVRQIVLESFEHVSGRNKWLVTLSSLGEIL